MPTMNRLYATTMLRGPSVTLAPEGAEGAAAAAPEAASDAPLSIDAAIQSLMPQEAASEAQTGAADEISEGDDQTPDENAEDDAETVAADAEETEGEPEAVVPADPPKYWSKEGKERWAALAPELQAVVLAQEGPREEAAAKAKAEAAEVRSRADAELATVNKLVKELGDFLPLAIDRFAVQWGEPDWVAYAKQYGGDQMAVAKAQYEHDRSTLQSLAAARAQAAEQVQAAELKAEMEKLKDVAPSLHGAEGQGEREKVYAYLEANGIDKDMARLASAAELNMAHKAMRWDDAQAKLKAAPKPIPKLPGKASSVVRPGAAAPGTPATTAFKSAEGRFHAKPSAENAIAYLLAKPKGP